MKLIPDPNCPYVVIVGAWNTKIFTPFWLKSQGITSAEEVEIELIFGAAEQNFQITFDGIKLSVTDTHLILRTKVWDPALVTTLEKVTVEILKSLQHTPMKAVGVNFDYLVEDPAPELLKLFKVPSLSAFNDKGLSPGEVSVAHTLNLEDYGEVNFVLASTEKGIKANINFHSKAATAGQACARIEGQILPFHAQAQKLLALFDLTHSKENDN